LIKANSHKHRLLERLNLGATSLDTLSLSIGQQNKEVKRLLKEMIEDKLVGFDTVDDYFITVEGLDMYQQVGVVSKPRAPRKTEPRTAYNWEPLKLDLRLERICHREGALDFLKYPSVFGGQRKERK
jgi:hypothetical protein